MPDMSPADAHHVFPRPSHELPRTIEFVVDSDTWGGAEVYVRHLLRRARGEGFEPVLLCAAPVAPGFTGLTDTAGRVIEVEVMRRLTRHAAAAPGLEQALRRRRPD